MRGADGLLTLSVRLGSTALPARLGPDGEVTRLLQETAEAIYARDLKSPYPNYLNRLQRWDELRLLSQRQLQSPDPSVQAKGWLSLGIVRRRLEGAAPAAEAFRIAISLDPTVAAPAANFLGEVESAAGREEGAYQAWIASGRSARLDPTITEEGRRAIENANQALLSEFRHDHLTALQRRRAFIRSGAPGFARPTLRSLVRNHAMLHETSEAARQYQIDRTTNGDWSPSTETERLACPRSDAAHWIAPWADPTGWRAATCTRPAAHLFMCEMFQSSWRQTLEPVRASMGRSAHRLRVVFCSPPG